MDQIVALVNRSQDLLMAGDFDGYVALFAENAVVLEPTGAVIEGRAHIREHVRQIASAFQSIEFVERKVFATGASAAMRFTLRLKLSEDRQVVMEGVDVFEFDEELRIHRATSYYDPTALGGPQPG
jgi:ketosteroid isomerase-like protein